MRPVQKVLTGLLWACAVLAMVSVIGANMWRSRAGGIGGAGVANLPQDAEEHLPVIKAAPAFSFIDQDGQKVTLETLRGRPWIADFIFTTCAGPCPVMTAKMAKLQEALPPGVRLISVTVDPANDTPAALKKYAKQFGADESRWRFLTVASAGDADAVYAFARGMLVAALPANEQNPIIHDERFILVDADANIRGYYHSGDAEKLAELKADAAELAATAPATATATGGADADGNAPAAEKAD